LPISARDQAKAQRILQLFQEHGHAVVELRFGGEWRQPRRSLRSTPPDDLVTVFSNELSEHDTSSARW
jgi:hypothetical protein